MSNVTCEVCKSVVLESRMKEHEKTKKHQNAVNGIKQHFCTECNLQLANRSSFSKHNKNMHQGLVRYNYHCTTSDIYMKDKKEVLTHRGSKKHFDVIRFLYYCDM